MKKQATIALFACGMAAGAAQAAMTLSPRGTGQVLLYPAYTTIKDQSTLVTLVNDGDRAKAVQLTFREGFRGRDVLSLRVFLGPRDAWNATVFQIWTLARDPGLISNDRSCVAPLNIGGTPQLPDGRRYWQFSRTYSGDINPTLPGYRLEQGNIEAIEQGEIKAGTALMNAVTAANGAAPACAGVENADLSTLLDPPGGGLYGAFSLVNAAAGTILSGNATAIDGFSVTSLGGLPVVDLAQGRTSANTSDPVEAHVDVGGRRVAVKYPRDRAIDAVSALLMVDTLSGEFVIDPNAGAKTDWVLTMPTRRYYADSTSSAVAPVLREPFLIRSNRGSPGYCSYYEADVRDRDQRAIVPRETYLLPTTVAARDVQSPEFLGPFPPSRSTHALCNDSEAVAFSRYVDVPGAFRGSGVVQYAQIFELVDAASGIDGGIARLRLGMPDPNGAAGTATTPSVLPAGVEGPALRGMPVIGFEATRYVNGTINYTSAVPLRSSAACATDVGAVASCP